MKQRSLKLLLSMLAVLVVIPAHAQIQAPGLDVLGFGYDVFGNYADQKSKKRYCLFKYNNVAQQVNNIGSQQYSVPKYVILENISNHITKEVEGSSMREYAKNQSASVGLEADGFFFSASVNSSFSKSSSGSERSYYYTYRDANTKWRISFDERRLNSLQEMLDPLFVEDLNNSNLSPADLFDRYGTHFIASAYLGGRADFNTKSVVTSQTNTSSIAIAVKAQYKAVSGSTDLSQDQKNTLSKSKTTSKLTVTGGNSEFANNIQDPVKYEQWAAGIADMPVLCDFDKHSLKPIWMFCKDAARKSALKAEFDRMVKANPLPAAMAASMYVSNQVYFIKNVGDGLYIDLPGYHFDAGRSQGTKVSMYPKDTKMGGLQGIDRFIKVIPHSTNPDYVFLRPQNSDLVMDVAGGHKTPGTKIHLWSKGENNGAQMFKLVEVDGKKNTYYIENKNSGLVLTSHGKSQQLTQEENTKAENQQWYLEPARAEQMMPVKTDYSMALRNVKANRYMDLGGRKAKARKKDEHIQLWDMDNDPDRYITVRKTPVDGWFYVFHNHASNYVWDIESKSTKNGAKLQLWDKTDTENQQFRFIYAGSAMTFYIQSKQSEKYLDASESRIAQNGCPVQIWSKNGQDQQKWKLEPAGPKWFAPKEPVTVKIKAAYSDKTWDLAGGGSEMAGKKSSQLQIYSDSDEKDRIYTIKSSGDASWIWFELNNGQMRIDVSGGDKNMGRKDVKLSTWTPHGNDSQKFAIRPTGKYTCIIFSKGWKAFDIEGGKYNENSADIQLWDTHYEAAQQFQLIDTKTGKPIDFTKYFN
ncbi:RICIN domain-containing protein [Marinilabilia rubra]|uniref:MACPF domain-containing protein n=1 Tax=Marinilabilia rubra TaxID=2162893 RepID=A0A2U2BCW9_9BACT|nr:RICIN domain-containing protein [Marinilabilia rubra]PWE00914.1 hypothetical protein DDZ16_00005 [Marinilabilia rubra]